MADKCVSVKVEVKKIFDKDLTKAVSEQLKSTIEDAVNKTKGLAVDKNCKEGWFLTATVVLLDVDDPASPKTMEAKIQIDGVELGGAASSFKANGSGKMSGVRAKKIEDDAAGLVNDIAADLMKDKVIPTIK